MSDPVQVPDGWARYSLKQLADKTDRYSFTGGPFGSNLKVDDYTENGIRIIQLQNIGDGQFLDKYKIYTSKEKADELLSCNIYPDDIILSKMGDPVARATIIPSISPRYVMASDGIRLAIDRNHFDNHFVLNAINFPSFRDQAETNSTGTTRKRIGLSELRELILIAPPLPEQKKIASILTSVDNVIEKTEAQISKLQDLKKGMMTELLTKGIGHTEFKDSPVGRIPKSWEVMKLIDLSVNGISNGVFRDPQKVGTGYKLINVFDMYQGFGVNPNHLELLSIPEKEFKNNKVERGDIFFTRSSLKLEGIAYCNIWLYEDDKTTYDGHIMRIRPNKDIVDPEYLTYYCLSGYARTFLMSSAKHSTMTTISQSDIAPLLVSMPPIEEQKGIVRHLNAIRSAITKKEMFASQTKALKKALMNDLLTGKKRVKVN